MTLEQHQLIDTDTAYAYCLAYVNRLLEDPSIVSRPNNGFPEDVFQILNEDAEIRAAFVSSLESMHEISPLDPRVRNFLESKVLGLRFKEASNVEPLQVPEPIPDSTQITAVPPAATAATAAVAEEEPETTESSIPSISVVRDEPEPSPEPISVPPPPFKLSRPPSPLRETLPSSTELLRTRSGVRKAVLLLLAGVLGAGLFEAVREHKDALPALSSLTDSSAVEAQLDPVLVAQAKEQIKTFYAKMLTRYQTEGVSPFDRTANEVNSLTLSTPETQRLLLQNVWKEMLGQDLMGRFVASKDQPFDSRLPLYEEVAAKQKLYLEAKKATGELVKMNSDPKAGPYFPEQVGKLEGIENDPDSLFMHRDFEILIPTILELVNEQVDWYNAHRDEIGVDGNAPNLARVEAVKISGAGRFVEHTVNMIQNGQAGRTTTDLTPHWIGQAVDIASYTTEGGHMFRLAEDFHYSKDGPVLYAKGEFLPNRNAAETGDTLEYAQRARELYSVMVGRALTSLVRPISNRHDGSALVFCWEEIQKNWHVGYRSAGTYGEE